MRAELLNLPEPQWFHHGERILELIEERRPKICVELGTNTGGSAIAVARLVSRWGGTVQCVDAWPDLATFQECRKNVADAGLAGVVSFFRARTHDEAFGRSRETIDYLYVDAGHTKEECRLDLEQWWPLLRSGGLIAGDDYDDPHGIPHLGVTAAWDAFESDNGLRFERELSTELIGCRCISCLNARLIWGVKP